MQSENVIFLCISFNVQIYTCNLILSPISFYIKFQLNAFLVDILQSTFSSGKKFEINIKIARVNILVLQTYVFQIAFEITAFIQLYIKVCFSFYLKIKNVLLLCGIAFCIKQRATSLKCETISLNIVRFMINHKYTTKGKEILFTDIKLISLNQICTVCNKNGFK